MTGTVHTLKLVVIGDSGVGKTSIRGQYISGRFSTGYRATIGADFISKTVPHPHKPDEQITLQIWDTAGQERFSSLSSAFFRGADAVLLMFDVNRRSTLDSLHRWWDEFRVKAPVLDEDTADFCCAVVGNKLDLAKFGEPETVTESQARSFVDWLVPPDLSASDHGSVSSREEPLTESDLTPDGHHPLADPIAIAGLRSKARSRSRAHSTRSNRSFFRGGGGTMTTTRTTVTIYHTPSSSVFDHFESAFSSPRPSHLTASSRSSTYSSHTRSHSDQSQIHSHSHSLSPARAPRRTASESESTVSEAPTITQSIYLHPRQAQSTPSVAPAPALIQTLPPALPSRPERRPKLFFTSAKTGDGVSDVFEYVASRVATRWEYDAARMHFDEGMEPAIRLGNADARSLRSGLKAWKGACCSS